MEYVEHLSWLLFLKFLDGQEDIFARSQQHKEVLYQEIALPDELKRFSKANLISDEHFAEARKSWQQMKAYRQGKALRPEVTETRWFENAETLAERGYDLTARNPSCFKDEKLPHPAELTALLLERNRQFQSLLERLHKIVSDGDEA
jgi:type I restriction enzyme M protein